MERRHKTRRWPWWLLASLTLMVAVVGPWPLPHEPYPDTPWARSTFQRLERLTVHGDHGPIQVGVARHEITPPPGVPLAGYGARRPKENTGALEPLYTTAITFAAGEMRVTVIGGDYLLPLPKLVRAVENATGLNSESLYFTASHTHSGPGGYDDGLISRTNLGAFHREYFQRLVHTMAETIRESRRRLQPARLRYSRLHLEGQAAGLFNYRLPQPRFRPIIHLLEAFRDGQRLAFLLTTDLHPTVLGKHNRLASGDFPSLLIQRLERRQGGIGLYAAGAVGGSVPGLASGSKPPQQDRARQRLAQTWSEAIQRKTEAATPKDEVQWTARSTGMSRARLTVELPPPSYHIGEHTRLNPWLVRALFHPSDTAPLDGLRIGPLYLIGIPADFSTELADELIRWGDTHHRRLWITGFNGDYLGYLMPRDRYATPHYTTREANFYGPWAGEYFSDLVRGLVERLSQNP